ncbi:MAG: UDP-N-acetylglucosamine 2-epimerase [Gordonibacter sp.]|uniref:UDP-N-acetylglucosamine 2-epimerase n=1 Tax=Gordonibacter sp. TaxID=1968902 RepID=UPI002FC7FB41
MKILVTGAKGFVGRNLCESLKAIRDGKDRREKYQPLLPLTIFEYDRESIPDELSTYCAEADFVFNLAGVNRPKDVSEFMEGNRDFASTLISTLERQNNLSPIMFASSTKASSRGCFMDGGYGKSKLAGENLFRDYSERTGVPVLIYRFPNVYGKWCRPGYNSVVATFCSNIANNRSITVNDPSTDLELLYIDDLVSEMLDALLGEETRADDGFCYVNPTDRCTLGDIVDLLHGFKAAREDISIPDVTPNSLSKKLYSTYLSYLDPADFSYKLKMNVDERGSFTEILHTVDRGQVSVNVSKPGITKGQHWHHTKWEKFCVVSGEGLIQLRCVGDEEDCGLHSVVEYHVSGEDITVVEMIPGYTHNIINLSDNQYLIIRLSEVIKKCRRYFDVILAHTGQNYDYNLNGVFFCDLKLDEPEVYLDAVGDTLGQTMGKIISTSYNLMVGVSPDAVLVLGDTNSCLSVISAKRLHIPIFHMEAGNRCKDECLPEETNRRIVDIISDVNLAYSEHARRYLANCGCVSERTYVTGSPMAEVLRANLADIEASDIHEKLGLEKGCYILLSAHREENIDTQTNFESLFGAVNALAEKYDMPVLYTCHPRSRKRLVTTGFKLDSRVRLHEPLGFHDYNNLQINAFAVVSDSGTLPEESSFFASIGRAFPAVCIRTSTERPEALDKACFTLAGISKRGLLQGVATAVALDREGSLPESPVPDYADETVSTKVVKIIQSYTDIVNKMVWRKY